MKKTFNLILLILFVIPLYNCSGYKPIFKSSNFDFIIADHNLEGEVEFGEVILARLQKASDARENSSKVKRISLSIKVNKDKIGTIKDSKGKTQEYKIFLETIIKVHDTSENELILDDNFSYSQSYKIQDSFADMTRQENKIIDDLLNKTFQELLIRLSEKL